MSDIIPPGLTAPNVYRLFDADGVLLYVGKSDISTKRASEHRDKPWWPEVRTGWLVFTETAAEAQELEAVAIRDEAPKYNAMTPLGSAERKRGPKMSALWVDDRSPYRHPLTNEPLGTTISVQEAAHMLGCSTASVRDYCKGGVFACLPRRGLNNQYRILTRDFLGQFGHLPDEQSA